MIYMPQDNCLRCFAVPIDVDNASPPRRSMNVTLGLTLTANLIFQRRRAL
jgi:hypothetical protein